MTIRDKLCYVQWDSLASIRNTRHQLYPLRSFVYHICSMTLWCNAMMYFQYGFVHYTLDRLPLNWYGKFLVLCGPRQSKKFSMDHGIFVHLFIYRTVFFQPWNIRHFSSTLFTFVCAAICCRRMANCEEGFKWNFSFLSRSLSPSCQIAVWMANANSRYLTGVGFATATLVLYPFPYCLQCLTMRIRSAERESEQFMDKVQDIFFTVTPPAFPWTLAMIIYT